MLAVLEQRTPQDRTQRLDWCIIWDTLLHMISIKTKNGPNWLAAWVIISMAVMMCLRPQYPIRPRVVTTWSGSTASTLKPSRVAPACTTWVLPEGP